MMFQVNGNIFSINGELKSIKPFIYLIGSKPKPINGVEDINEASMNGLKWDGLGYREGGYSTWRITINDPKSVRRISKAYMKMGYLVSQSGISHPLKASINEAYRNLNTLEDTLNSVESVIMDALSRRLRVLTIDVEVTGGKPIYGYTLGDDVIITSNERDLRNIDFDIAVTYNGWGFDANYLPLFKNSKYALATEYGIKPLMDLYVFVDSGFKASLGVSEEASKLYDVAIQLGIHRDLGLSEGDLLRIKRLQSRVGNITTTDLVNYLSLDVIVTHELALRWIPVLQALGALTGSNPMIINQVAEEHSPGHLAEALIYRYLELNGLIPQDRVRELDYEAGDKARVRSSGLFRNVVEYDFSAMYPSLYTQDNVDPINITECQNGFKVKAGGMVKEICFKPNGHVHRVLSSLYNARRVTKALKARYGDAPDKAIKILVNSAYGIFGKRGTGLVNEWIAGYIAQKAQEIFNDLWNRYNPIYGDTDSLYIIPSKDPTIILNDINNYLNKAYGPLMEVKIEDTWDIIYIPLLKNNTEPAEKTYIKIKDSKVILKGGALKPRDLPIGLRFGEYREWVKLLLLNQANLSDLIKNFTENSRLEELFIESSIMFKDLIYTQNGNMVKSIDRSRFPILAQLALVNNGEAIINIREGELNGRKINPSEFIDVLYLPIKTNSEIKDYIILIGNKPIRVKVKITLDHFLGRIEARVLSTSEVNPDTVKRISEKVIRESNLFSHIKPTTTIPLNTLYNKPQ